jgi:ACR3 family arsenite efflux pump ArsB
METRNRLKALSGFGMILLLFTIFVLNGRQMTDHPALLFRIVGPVASFLVILLIGSVSFGRMVHLHSEDSAALSISTMAKNNAISLALALSAFGSEVAMTNAIAGPLVQFPFMLLFLKFWKSGYPGLES